MKRRTKFGYKFTRTLFTWHLTLCVTIQPICLRFIFKTISLNGKFISIQKKIEYLNHAQNINFFCIPKLHSNAICLKKKLKKKFITIYLLNIDNWIFLSNPKKKAIIFICHLYVVHCILFASAFKVTSSSDKQNNQFQGSTWFKQYTRE